METAAPHHTDDSIGKELGIISLSEKTFFCQFHRQRME